MSNIEIGDWVIVRSRGNDRRVGRVTGKKKIGYRGSPPHDCPQHYYNFGVEGFITSNFKLIDKNRRRRRHYPEWELERFDASWIDKTWGAALKMCEEESND